MTRLVTIPAVIMTLVLAGCAKQPTTTQLTSPAPDGATAGAQSGTDGARLGSGSADGRGGAGAGSSGSGSGSRPSPGDFRPATELADVHFDYDKADIREVDVRILEVTAGWLREHPSTLLLIEGHCDERGTNEYNTALGDRRAKATMNYLVSRGVAASRITVISYGEERPACSQHDASCWAKNRRAHFLVKPR
jgi:peptidoglycan-associated lipoprotein